MPRAGIMTALESENAVLREENNELRGQLSNLRRVRRQWAKDFATIEAQVREGQRSFEQYATLAHKSAPALIASASVADRVVPDGASCHAAPPVTSDSAQAHVPPSSTEADKDQLIEKLAYTCESLRQQLQEARAEVVTRGLPAVAVPPAEVDDGAEQADVEGLLVENARLREALARSERRSPTTAASPPAPTATAPTHECTERLETAEREVLALSLQNEELLRDVRHYMWLASTRLTSTAEDAARLAAIPAAEEALHLLSLKSHTEARLEEDLRRLAQERDSLQEALDRALSQARPHQGEAEETVSLPYLDAVEAEAEDVLQQMMAFCGSVAEASGTRPLVELWRRACAHGTQQQPALLPSLPDAKFEDTPVHHLIGVLRGIRYVSRRYMEALLSRE